MHSRGAPKPDVDLWLLRAEGSAIVSCAPIEVGDDWVGPQRNDLCANELKISTWSIESYVSN
jgi:hypothetical protein